MNVAPTGGGFRVLLMAPRTGFAVIKSSLYGRLRRRFSVPWSRRNRSAQFVKLVRGEVLPVRHRFDLWRTVYTGNDESREQRRFQHGIQLRETSYAAVSPAFAAALAPSLTVQPLP